MLFPGLDRGGAALPPDRTSCTPGAEHLALQPLALQVRTKCSRLSSSMTPAQSGAMLAVCSASEPHTPPTLTIQASSGFRETRTAERTQQGVQ